MPRVCRRLVLLLLAVLALCACTRKIPADIAGTATSSVTTAASSDTSAASSGTSAAEAASAASTADVSVTETSGEADSAPAPALSEDASCTSKEDVALYLHTYGKLPSNFITKNKARDLGWDASKGNLQKVAPGMSIGGDKFGNREGLLPEKNGRQYYECDIDYDGGSRNAKRIVYSDDGLIFYTDDHYASFEQLY